MWFEIVIPAKFIGSIPQPKVLVNLPTVNKFIIGNYHLLGDTIFPYKHFVNVERVHNNCVINMLCYKFSGKLSSRRIYEFFNGSDITYRKLVQFFQAKSINYHIYDIVGKIVDKYTEYRQQKSISCMIFDHHICLYDKDLTTEIDFTPQFEHDVPGWYDGKSKTKSKLVIPKIIYTPGLDLYSPNFTFKCEKRVTPTSMMYQNINYSGQTLPGGDMTKAFYNCVFRTDDDEPIGIFSVNDEILPYQGEKIISYATYYIKEHVEPRWRTNNIMFGFTLILELNSGRLNRSDISHAKVPKLTSRNKVLKDTFKDKGYALYNGILGSINIRGKRKSLIVSKSDLELLIPNNPSIIIDDIVGDKYLITIQETEDRFRYLNNRNYYMFVIELCNFYMVKAIDEHPTLEVIRIWVDGVIFNKPVTLDIKYFHDEEMTVRKQQPKFNYIDPEKLIESITDELESLYFKIKVITGAAGTGKTTYVKDQLEYDHAMSYTNKVALLIGGKTIHRTLSCNKMSLFVKNMKMFKNETIWIDEFSQIPGWIWSCLYTLSVTQNVKLIFTGDPNQLFPYGEITNYDSIFFTGLLRRAKELTVNHRCSKELVKLAENIRDGGSIPENLFHTDFHPEINYHFTFTHNCRIEVNNLVMKARGLTYNPPSVGLRVAIFEANRSYNIVKGQIYNIIKVDALYVMKLLTSELIVHLPPDIYLQCCQPGYASTVDASIGSTVREPMALYEVDKIFRSGSRRLYTGITRTNLVENLAFYHKYAEGMNVERTKLLHNNVTSSLIHELDFKKTSILTSILTNIDSLNFTIIDHHP